jgi:hypothetical protein
VDADRPGRPSQRESDPGATAGEIRHLGYRLVDLPEVAVNYGIDGTPMLRQLF